MHLCNPDKILKMFIKIERKGESKSSRVQRFLEAVGKYNENGREL
jgi:hypothetical protein